LAAGRTFPDTYKNLTGDAGDPNVLMSGVL
jgi:hypothetical protein